MPTATRAQAVAKIKSGDVLAAVVIPRDIAARLSSDITQAHLEVLYNGNALEQSLVQSSLELGARAGQPRLLRTDPAGRRAGDRPAAAGGNLGFLGAPSNLLGLSEIPPLLRGVIARQPPGPTARRWNGRSPSRASPPEPRLSKTVIGDDRQPIAVNSTLLHGRRTPLNTSPSWSR